MKLVISILCLTLFSTLVAEEVRFLHPKVIELGKINQGTTLNGEIRFINEGAGPLELEEITPSCGCTAVTPDKMVFASGDTAVIPFSIKTEKFTGVIRKSIKLVFKNTEPRTHVIFAQAKVTTDINISPRFVNFQNTSLNPDTTLTEFFEIENESEKAIHISRIHTDSQFLKVFPESVDIPPGKSHLVRIELIPSQIGRHSTYVHINADHEAEKEKSLPVFINILEQL